mgnify:CR=1 FL=1
MRLVDPDDPDVQVEPGRVGELLARGPQIFPGYWGDPEETEATLLPGGWLRTGDLVRQEDDGFYVIADRRKELIISGGFNVYPTEVEAAVRSMPQVEDVAVVGLPGDSGNENVVAAILPKEGQTVTLEQVRAWAEKTLSHYALPRQIAILSEMPRSVIGKVLRRAVREELLAAREAASDAASAAEKASQEALQVWIASSGLLRPDGSSWRAIAEGILARRVYFPYRENRAYLDDAGDDFRHVKDLASQTQLWLDPRMLAHAHRFTSPTAVVSADELGTGSIDEVVAALTGRGRPQPETT